MIKGILIDFGGTIDSDGIHWFDQFRDAYSLVASVPESLLWDAYVHAERTLGRNPIIGPDYTFCKTLQTKIALQTEYLQCKGVTITAQYIIGLQARSGKDSTPYGPGNKLLRQHAHRPEGVQPGSPFQRRNRIRRSRSPQTRSPNLPLGSSRIRP